MNQPNDTSYRVRAPKRWQTPTVASTRTDRDTNGGGNPGGPDVMLTTTTVGS